MLPHRMNSHCGHRLSSRWPRCLTPALARDLPLDLTRTLPRVSHLPALASLLLCLAVAPSARAQAAGPAPTALAAGRTVVSAAALGPALAAQPQAESLQALLARVLPHDPQVRSAQALLAAAQERQVQARSRLGPSVTLSSSYGRSQETELGRQIDRRTERTEAGVRWNLYNFGNDLAEKRASEREVAAASEDLRRAREDVVGRIAEAYAEVLRLEALLPRAVERLDALRRLADQVQRQFEAGKASDADAQQAQASMLEAEIVHQQLGTDGASARARLRALAGDAGSAIGPLLPLDLPLPTSADAPPDPGQVAAAQARAEAARRRVRPVTSLFAPRVDLEYRHRLADGTTPQVTTEQQNGWLLTARWEVPLGGELQSRRAEGERRAEAAEAEADRVVQSVQAELVTLGPRITQARRAVVLLDRQLAQYDSLVRAGELQFEAGRRTLAQLMQLHDNRFNAEQRRADQQSRLLLARLRQLALTGELLPALGVDPR